MLLLEQYLVIYLFSVYLSNDTNIKILCGFLAVDFIIDSILYNYLKWSVYEYLISITFIEITLLFFTIQFVKDWKLKNLFIFCYAPTILAPMFILTLDHWINRNDFISYALFIFCKDVGKYSNEIFLTYILYKKNDKSLKMIYWQIFIFCNYVYAFVR